MIKNKSFIRMIAFLTAVIIFLVCVILNGFSIFASSGMVANDTQYLLKDVFNVSDTYYSKEDYDNVVGYDTDYSSLYESALSQSLPFTFYSVNNGSTYETYFNNDGGYVLYGDNNFSTLYFALGSSGSFIVSTSTYNMSNVYLCYKDISSLPFHPNFGVYSIESVRWSTSNGSGGWTSNLSNVLNVTFDGESYGAIPITKYVVNTSLPIYSNESISFLSDNSNYDLSDFSNVFNPSQSGSSETADNNLVLSKADFTFSNDRFVAPYSSLINTGGIYPNGSITFSGLPNSYQINHPEQFTLTFGFQFRYDVTYKNQGESDFGPFKTTSTLLNTKKKYNTQLYYNNGGVETIDVPLSEFISHGNSYSWTMQSILEHMTGEYDYSTILSQSKELTEVNYNAFDIVCNAYISSGLDSSGEYSEWYNPMSNKGYTTSENMKVNDNPYYGSATEQGDNDYYGDLSAPGSAGNGSSSGSGSSSSTSSSSTGEIVINNYNEVNVDSTGGSGSGSGSGSPSSSEEAGLAFNFYNTFNPFSLIFNKLTDDTELVSDEVQDTIGSNSFLTFVSSSFSFMPESFWSDIAFFFGACLVILIIAFIFKVIISLL